MKNARCIKVKRSIGGVNWWVVLEVDEHEDNDVVLAVRDTLWEANELRDSLQTMSDRIITA